MSRPVNTPSNTNKSFEFGSSSKPSFKSSSDDGGTEDRISKLFQNDSIKLGLAAASSSLNRLDLTPCIKKAAFCFC